MPARYPTDRSACMKKDGPDDRRYRVPGGILQFRAHRDARFPYLYEVPTHALVHSPEYIIKILVHVVDTSINARITRAEFEDTLSVPLGPNYLMTDYG